LSSWFCFITKEIGLEISRISKHPLNTKPIKNIPESEIMIPIYNIYCKFFTNKMSILIIIRWIQSREGWLVECWFTKNIKRIFGIASRSNFLLYHWFTHKCNCFF
jgi:hypothetical protein